MAALPVRVMDRFVKGERVVRHIPWIWSDMYIETTFMRYGHGKGGIIGITLQPEILKTWALCLHICSKLESNLSEMIDDDGGDVKNVHKEEAQNRISKDRKEGRKYLI